MKSKNVLSFTKETLKDKWPYDPHGEKDILPVQVVLCSSQMNHGLFIYEHKHTHTIVK